jgi:hypothetical protein
MSLVRHGLLQCADDLLHRSSDRSRLIRRGLLHRSDELRATSELYTDEFHAPDEPPFPSSKEMLRLKRMVQTYVAGVSEVCCKCFVSVLQK